MVFDFIYSFFSSRFFLVRSVLCLGWYIAFFFCELAFSSSRFYILLSVGECCMTVCAAFDVAMFLCMSVLSA